MCFFAVRHEFDSEHVPDLTKDTYIQDIHSVGSLCKLYFRELPNPLLTYQLYDKFSVSTSSESAETSASYKHLHVTVACVSFYRTQCQPRPTTKDWSKSTTSFSSCLLHTTGLFGAQCKPPPADRKQYCRPIRVTCFSFHFTSRTLEFLMRHLAHMAAFSHVTNMHSKNLAIVWAPNLLRYF